MSKPTREQFETYMQEFMPEADVIASGDNETSIRPKSGTTICDFCSTQPAPHLHDARNVEVGPADMMGSHVSIGAWGACEECNKLLRRKDRHGLVERAAKLLNARHADIPLSVTRDAVRIAHASFWSARTP